jgi:Raf kinase inhibitor-like YbhB/YbcL family protein
MLPQEVSMTANLKKIFFVWLCVLLLCACAGNPETPAVAAVPTANPPTQPTVETVPAASPSKMAPGGAQANPPANQTPATAVQIQLTSPAFQPDQAIPQKFSCDGQNVSPALDWKDAPLNTVSLALIVDDPDAPSGTFTHWVLYNIPPTQAGLAEGVSGVGTGGPNGRGSETYTGPCPPAGKPHHYHFKLYAADIPPDLPGGLKPAQLLNKLQGHILAQAELIGLYQR